MAGSIMRDDVDYRSMPEYRDGVQEFHRTYNARSKCPDSPYETGPRKIAWLIGWLDARTCASLPKTFPYHGV